MPGPLLLDAAMSFWHHCPFLELLFLPHTAVSSSFSWCFDRHCSLALGSTIATVDTLEIWRFQSHHWLVLWHRWRKDLNHLPFCYLLWKEHQSKVGSSRKNCYSSSVCSVSGHVLSVFICIFKQNSQNNHASWIIAPHLKSVNTVAQICLIPNLCLLYRNINVLKQYFFSSYWWRETRISLSFVLD